MLAKENPQMIKKVELAGVDEHKKRQFVDLLLDPMFDKIVVKTVERRFVKSAVVDIVLARMLSEEILFANKLFVENVFV